MVTTALDPSVRRRFISALTLALAACGGGGDDPGVDGGPRDGRALPRVPGVAQIGGVDERGDFTPLPPAANLELEAGSQGGFHVPIQVRIDAEARAALGASSFHIREARRTRDDRLTSGPIAFDLRWVEAEDGWFQMDEPLFMFLCPTPIGVEVADEELRLAVTVGDPDEVTPLVDSATITARCPAGAQARFCDEICRG